jgi:hypothetical protein
MARTCVRTERKRKVDVIECGQWYNVVQQLNIVIGCFACMGDNGLRYMRAE